MTNIVKDRIKQVQSGIIPYGYTWKWHLMPVTWKDVSLSEIFSLKAPKNKGNQFGIVFTNSAERGIIPQSDYFDKIIANQENTEGYYIVRPGDYVYNPRISENAPYGPFRRNNTGITGIVSPLYTVLIPKSGYKHSEFLRYYLESDQWHKYAYSIANYGARFDRMNITSQDLMELPIALPPIDEQGKIAEILAQCDEVIALKQRRLAEEYERHKGLMASLFSSFRKPVTKIPLKNCGRWFSGGTPDKSNENYWTQGSIKWVSSQEVKGNQIKDTTFRVTPLALAESATAVAPAYSLLLVTRSGVLKHSIPVAYISEDMAINQDIKALIPNNDINYYYLLSYLKYKEKELVASYVKTGTTVESIIMNLFLKYEVPFPDCEEQIKIADIIRMSDRKMQLLSEELEYWKEGRTALMHLLLSGIVRVKV